MRILIVEDSDSIRHMIETLLSARGHWVEAVPSGAKGIDAAIARPPEVILLDLHLPWSFDGFAVCNKLRAAARRVGHRRRALGARCRRAFDVARNTLESALFPGRWLRRHPRERRASVFLARQRPRRPKRRG